MIPLRNFFVIVMMMAGASPLSAGESIDPMREYLGRWVGHFKVQSTATGQTEVFPVEQRYWLEDGRLKGLAVILRGAGMETSSSVTYRDGEVFVSEVKRGDRIDRYLGLAHEDGIIWYSSDLERVNDYQIEDSFASFDGAQVLRTEGFDLRDLEGKRVGVLYQGELTRESD